MIKNFYRICAYSLCLFCLIVCPKAETDSIMTFTDIPEECLDNITVHQSGPGERSYTITDLSYANRSRQAEADCVLSFNREASSLWKDDTGKYTIAKADYDFIPGSGSMGGGCAYFYKNDHEVDIETEKNLWLGSCNDLGSFSIEFRFKPDSTSLNAVLFSRLGFYSGEKKGIEIKLKNGIVSVTFHKVFEKDGARRYDVYLNRGQLIREGEWNHLLVTYNRMSGKLAKFINGTEDEVVFVTDGGEPYNNVYMPSFGYRDSSGVLRGIDAPRAVIGKGYSGYIDEFRISYVSHEDDIHGDDLVTVPHRGVTINGRKPANTEGIITSPVYSFDQTGTMIKEIRWSEELKKDTFIWMELRIADYLFDKNDSALPWYRATNKQRNIFLTKDRSGTFLRGKYFQWKFHLVPSPQGNFSPVLKNIQVDYQLDTSPSQPKFLEVVESGDRYVTLRWIKNVDADIMGYRIYYGPRENMYDGIISLINEKMIANDMTRKNYIEITLTNEIIEENMKLDKKGILTFPLFENTVLYYFAVSAYDTYKPGTSFNHESSLSNRVSARPYAGSEID